MVGFYMFKSFRWLKFSQIKPILAFWREIANCEKCIWWQLFSFIFNIYPSRLWYFMHRTEELKTVQPLINFYLYNTPQFYSSYLVGYNASNYNEKT